MGSKKEYPVITNPVLNLVFATTFNQMFGEPIPKKTTTEKPRFIIDYDNKVISCPKCKIGIPIDSIEGKEIFSMECSSCGHKQDKKGGKDDK